MRILCNKIYNLIDINKFIIKRDLTDKIIKLFHPIFQQKNFIEGIFTLLQNGYPRFYFFCD